MIALDIGKKVQSPIYDNKITKEIGKMKDEFNGETIGKLVSLRAKTYSLKTKKEEKGSEDKQTVNACAYTSNKECSVQEAVYHIMSELWLQKTFPVV